MTLLQEITEANKSFLSGNPHLLDSTGECFIVLSCIDPRLTAFLEPALGLPKNRALVVRTAGNQISASCNDALRSIVAGVYLKGGTEIFIVGHTDCALSRFSASDVIENFRKAGVSRSAFGDADIRAWFGAFHDVKANVVQSVEYLRRCGLIPQSLKVHGLVLDIQDGKLDVVCNGDTLQTTPVPPPEPTPPSVLVPAVLEHPSLRQPEASLPSPPPLPSPGPISSKKPAERPSKPEMAKAKPAKQVTPTSMMDAAMILREFFVRERSDQKFQRTVAEFSALVKREKNPVIILNHLEKVVMDYQREYPNLPAALAFLRKSLESRGPGTARFLEMIARVLE